MSKESSSKESSSKESSQIAKLEQQIYSLQEKLRISETNFGFLYEDNPVMHATINPLTGYIVNCNSMLVTNLGYKNVFGPFRTVSHGFGSFSDHYGLFQMVFGPF